MLIPTFRCHQLNQKHAEQTARRLAHPGAVGFSEWQVRHAGHVEMFASKASSAPSDSTCFLLTVTESLSKSPQWQDRNILVLILFRHRPLANINREQNQLLTPQTDCPAQSLQACQQYIHVYTPVLNYSQFSVVCGTTFADQKIRYEFLKYLHRIVKSCFALKCKSAEIRSYSSTTSMGLGAVLTTNST